MAIVIKPLNENFKIEIAHEEEKLTFTFRQLDYKTKSLISSITTDVKQGQYMSDSTMQIFYNLKYGLKKVEGLETEDGKPYKLRFESKDKIKLEDACVDELLATEFSDKLQYTAHKLSYAVLHTEITNPLTGEKLEGVELVNTGGVKKK